MLMSFMELSTMDNMLNYDNIGFFVSIAQIFPTDGHAMTYLNWDWISPCDHVFMIGWW